MDLLSIMAALFLNLSTGCDALKADVQRIQGQDYLVQSWTCKDKRGEVHIWRTWQRECMSNRHATFWGRPYFLEDVTSQMAFYANRFGELQGGFGAPMDGAYVPLCGS